MAAYDSALRNACVPSPRPETGRKGIATARFTGYVDTDTPEGFSWSMDNANSDAAIAAWSERLCADSGHERHDEFRANALWFRHRALGYQQLFDAETGFFRARRPADGAAPGAFRGDAEGFDPMLWGRDYTETNAWGMAFHAPFDGAGLAELYGGEDALAAKLEQAFALPESASPRVGRHYGGVIHEMLEARAFRMGQVAMSNQPAHHIPAMWSAAGRHDRTQWAIREILERGFTGSAIGQGYPGDEDNGEMSAWWLLAALGLFPLGVGQGEMLITAPLFERMAFRRDDGTLLQVTAGNIDHRHIQWVTVNGRPWDRVTVPTAVLHDGDVHLHVELGREPSDWARDSRPFSLSNRVPGGRWQGDLTASGEVTRHRADGEQATTHLCDDRGDLEQLQAGDVVEVRWPEPVRASVHTLTTEDLLAAPVRVEHLGTDGTWREAYSQPRPALWADQTQAYLLDASGTAVEVLGVRWRVLADTLLRQVEVWG